MSFTSSIRIRAGHLTGRGYWNDRLQSYAVELRLFDEARSYPPSTVVHGTRTAEFITPDALANYLVSIGLRLDEDSVVGVHDLGMAVAEERGRAEVVGLSDDSGRRQVFMLTPSRRLLRLNSRLEHPDHHHSWGNVAPATVETARLICDQVWVRRPDADIEAFALALTHEILADAGDDFSLDAVDLCDWYLTDAEPSTSLTAADLAGFRQTAGVHRRRLPAVAPAAGRDGATGGAAGGDNSHLGVSH